MKRLHQYPTIANIIMFYLAECAETCLVRPLRISILGSNNVVLKISMWTSRTLYCSLPATYFDLEFLRIECISFVIHTGFGLTYQ